MLLDVFTYLAIGVYTSLLVASVGLCGVQDTYVLHDNAFRLLQHLSEGNQYREEAQTVSGVHSPSLYYPPYHHNTSLPSLLFCIVPVICVWSVDWGSE